MQTPLSVDTETGNPRLTDATPRVFRRCEEYMSSPYMYGSDASPGGPALLDAYISDASGEMREDMFFKVSALYGPGKNWGGSEFYYRALLDTRHVGMTMHMRFSRETCCPAQFERASSRRVTSLSEILNPPLPESAKDTEMRDARVKRVFDLAPGMAYCT